MTQFENSFSFTRLLNCEMYQLTDDAYITGDIFKEYNRKCTNRIWTMEFVSVKLKIRLRVC